MGRHPGITDYLEAGLKGLALRQAVIANNIANLGTPGYRRADVRFEQLLAGAIRGGGVDPAEIRPVIFRPMTTPVDGEGNDVQLETEIGNMVRNGAIYKTYIRLLSKLYRQMELAIRGQ